MYFEMVINKYKNETNRSNTKYTEMLSKPKRSFSFIKNPVLKFVIFLECALNTFHPTTDILLFI